MNTQIGFPSILPAVVLSSLLWTSAQAQSPDPGAATPKYDETIGSASLSDSAATLRADATGDFDEAKAILVTKHLLQAMSKKDARAVRSLLEAPAQVSSDGKACRGKLSVKGAKDAKQLKRVTSCLTADEPLSRALTATATASVREATRADVSPYADEAYEGRPGLWTITDVRDATTIYNVLVRVEGLAKGPRVREVIIVRQPLSETM